MPKYTLNTTEQSITWPTKCIVCGENTTGTGISECNVTKNVKYKFLWWEHNYASLSIKYPICNKHKYLYWFPTFLSKRSLLNLGLSIILICIVTIYTAAMARSIFAIDVNSKYIGLLAILSFIFSIWLIYYLSNLLIKCTPVKMLSFDDVKIVILINNKKYAQEFEKANSAIISKKP